MFKNFLRTAIRNISRNKAFSIINIGGLTLGLTACLLIGLFVWDEKQYDQFAPDRDRIYRVYNERKENESMSRVARTAPMYAASLKQDYPEVQSTLRVMNLNTKNLFEVGEKQIYQQEGIAAEEEFFKFFPIPFKFGSKVKALDDVNSIVISEEISNQFFGNTDPVGKTLLLDKQPFVIKGVMDSRSLRFHMPVNFFISFKALGMPEERMQRWTYNQFFTYIMLKPGASVANLEKKFAAMIDEKVNPIIRADNMSYRPFFQPLSQVHLYSMDMQHDLPNRGNITYVRALTIIAIFILLIACFNFVNLATANSLKRAKEVGVRKSIGASRKQLIFQFTGETILLSIISVIVSAILAAVFLPLLNQFTEKQILMSVFYKWPFLLSLLILAFGVGLLAGFYPALVLSGFQPVKVLKGNTSSDLMPGRVPWLRHGLVVVQFALSTLLIVSAIIVIRQVNYLHNKDLGLNKDQIMFFPMRGDNLYANMDAFKSEVLNSPGVVSTTMGYGFPGDIFAGDQILVPAGGERKTYPITHLLVDHDYIKTLGLQLVAGRDFSNVNSADENHAFILNETAAQVLGFGNALKALGQPLLWPVWESQQPDSLKEGRVIGVVKDFNYKSLYEKVGPAIIHIYRPAYWKVAVKMNTANIGKTIDDVKTVWSRFAKDYPIEYNFLDEQFNFMYKAEVKLMSLVFVFTGIAIFIACLGLFGLAAYSAERRKKEIGIRKVLGATVNGLVLLLSKHFLVLVVISLLIASPIAYYFMNQWLQDFAYRIDIQWWMFALASCMAILIALITVSLQAVKAALANPVKSIRTE